MNQSNQTTTNLPLHFLSSTTTTSNTRTHQLNPSTSCLILDQINSSSDFIILDLIHQSIKSKHQSIIFINTSNSIQHWIGLLQKQGIQINHQIKQGSFKFINPSFDQSLQDLFISIQHSINHNSSSTNSLSPLLIIDDLSSFLWSGYALNQILDFVNQIRSLQHELTILRGPALLSDLKLPVTLSQDTITQYRIHDNSVSYHTKGLDKGFL
ncbi:hypothetical protein DFH28DRAFT_1158429 [Melampsora americana]|nr:hypothetical protein DFH28DRAFT_1158429 [Melampsora americana]